MVQLHRFFSYLAVHPKAFAIHPSSFFIFLTSRFDVDQYHQQWTNVLKVWSNELMYSCFGQCSYNYRFDQFWSLKIDVNFICMTYIYKGKPKLLIQLQWAKMIINMLWTSSRNWTPPPFFCIETFLISICTQIWFIKPTNLRTFWF